MKQIDDFVNTGFTTIDNIYTVDEVENLINLINQTRSDKDTFRKSADLFAIRQFLNEIPETINVIFNIKLRTILDKLFGEKYFIVKSIYFDKPASSNWYVSYHQDLTISVDNKREIEGFQFWTIKQNQFAVQPPLEILQNIVTIRIHLDRTDENNGALKVVPKSHLKGIYRPENIDWNSEKEVCCKVSKGGIMLMKPLLLHSSGRTVNNLQRRVIHIELSNIDLPKELNWSERINLN
jgi:ectoine hydroxylase-related dioxygenase (phytanoyl-CoA dioxygenase family)